MLTHECKTIIKDQYRAYYSEGTMLEILKHIRKKHKTCTLNHMILFWYKLEREAHIMNR